MKQRKQRKNRERSTTTTTEITTKEKEVKTNGPFKGALHRGRSKMEGMLRYGDSNGVGDQIRVNKKWSFMP